MLNENDAIKAILGLKIKEERQKKKFSLSALASQSGLSVSYLNEIEKGKKYPKADKMMSLARALDMEYDALVSLKVSKSLKPITSLLNSPFFKEFPLELFGIDSGKLVEILSGNPDKVTAIIKAIVEIARYYDLNESSFYLSALRSYQELQDNYFPELEKEAKRLRKEVFGKHTIGDTQKLSAYMEEVHQLKLEEISLDTEPELIHIRSIFNQEKNTLYISPKLSEAQKRFILGREIAIRHLGLTPRPLETPPQQPETFSLALHNFKASYFSVALLMEEKSVVKDVARMAAQKRWNEALFIDFIEKYKCTPEMLMQRLTNILPKVFGLKNLFFLRFQGKYDERYFQMTKELHLSGLHNPHASGQDEHYCRRWISIKIMDELRQKQQAGEKVTLLSRAQISSYHDSKHQYLCFSVAKPNVSDDNDLISVTIGFLIDDNLRKKIGFLADKSIPKYTVNRTCERCPISDCKERAVPPTQIKRQKEQQAIQIALEQYLH